MSSPKQLAQNSLVKASTFVSGLSKTTKVIVVGIAIGVAAMLSYSVIAGTLRDDYADEIAAHQKTTKAALLTAAKAIKTVDSLQFVVKDLKRERDILDSVVSKTTKKTSVLKKKADSTAAGLDTSKTTKDSLDIYVALLPQKDSIITSQDLTITQQALTITNLDTQIEKKDAIIVTIQASNEALQKVVQTIPKVNKCENKFFFCKLQKPSRVVSFVSGAAVTIATAVVLR